MRTNPAAPTELPELALGRLAPSTLHRLSSARSVHHRTGPWTACSEDFSRVLRVGADIPLASTRSLPHVVAVPEDGADHADLVAREDHTVVA